MLTSTFTRSRVIYFIMILIVIGLGLASRRYSEVLPDFISRYAGDTLWALMVFLVIGFLFPSRSTWKVAVIALLFSLLIEASQLYHAPWLEEIRRYRLAALILGRGFLWSDLGCYSVGVTLGILLEKLIINMNYRINAIKLRIKHKHKKPSLFKTHVDHLVVMGSPIPWINTMSDPTMKR